MAEEQPHDEAGTWVALSSLVDGEADALEQARCLALWHEDSHVRERWHRYQLIGDAMRSAELAETAMDDAAFLQALRTRMALEPPRVAAVAPVARTRAHPRWMAPVAMAAGVGAVALTLNSLWPQSAPPGTELAAAAVRLPASAVAAPGPTQVHVVNGQLIRDARLDRYLAAHRQSATGAALQMPGAVVRSVDTIVLDAK